MSGEQLRVIKKITFLNAILKSQVNNILVKKILRTGRDSMIIYQQSVDCGSNVNSQFMF